MLLFIASSNDQECLSKLVAGLGQHSDVFTLMRSLSGQSFNGSLAGTHFFNLMRELNDIVPPLPPPHESRASVDDAIRLDLQSPSFLPLEREREREGRRGEEMEMERAAPVRSSHTSTAGLLAWPHPDGAGSLPARRPNQPTEEFRKVVFGGQATEKADGHNKTKMRTTGSAPKGKEISGIGIFKAESAAAAVVTASRDRQASQITFSQDGTIPARKPTSVSGVARQRELSHTVDSEGDSKMKRLVSSAKSKELSGNDIFADHEVPKPNRSRRSDYGSSAALSPMKNANVSSFSFGEADMDSTVKTAKKKGTGNKSIHLNGKAISGRDSVPAEKQPPNRAKPKGMSGSSIFADGKASTTGDHAGRRTRQPPGGDSSILLG